MITLLYITAIFGMEEQGGLAKPDVIIKSIVNNSGKKLMLFFGDNPVGKLSEQVGSEKLERVSTMTEVPKILKVPVEKAVPFELELTGSDITAHRYKTVPILLKLVRDNPKAKKDEIPYILTPYMNISGIHSWYIKPTGVLSASFIVKVSDTQLNEAEARVTVQAPPLESEFGYILNLVIGSSVDDTEIDIAASH